MFQQLTRHLPVEHTDHFKTIVLSESSTGLNTIQCPTVSHRAFEDPVDQGIQRLVPLLLSRQQSPIVASHSAIDLSYPCLGWFDC